MSENLVDVNIAKEMNSSFLSYAMSVIVSRALPDVRDGLKPVHRRILYSMYELGITADKSHRKCARIVGDVLGKYHPHGDSSVYEALVRMAQDFSMRYTLVDGHGNFGSIDGDGAAAMRYTESKMSKIAMELVRDINKNTIDFVPNFDGEEKEPVVLPSRIPTLLVNGSSGIAVGMATNIPPHNLTEVIDGLIAYIDNHDIDTAELMTYIKGPDFPTAGIILGSSGIKKAYETGRGVITIRSKAEIEEAVSGKQTIVITEIPYQTNKSVLVTRIADLVREKIIEGISDLRDESNREGIRIAIELKREANAHVILNNLYKHTSLQNSYGINMLALVDGQPRTLKLKEFLEKYLEHQQSVIIRRTEFDLDKNLKRAHILEGLKIALDNIDEVIKLIKSAKNDQDALNGLITKFGLTDTQAQAILEMKLRRLTGLERDKIEAELKELMLLIEELRELLASNEKILNVIKDELLEVRDKFGDERRTKIDMTAIEFIEDESLIPEEEIIITLTSKGYIKRLPKDTYKLQNRGGVGIKGMTTNEEDVVENVLVLSSHDFVMFFTNKGKTYRVKGYEIPEYSRQAKGLPIVNLLPVDKDESVNSILKVGKEELNQYLVFATKNGIVKRTELKEFENIRTTGKIAITLKDDDELIAVKKTNGENEILLASNNGRMVRFKESEIRIMGRTATGVKGIQMDANEVCVGAEIVSENEEVLVVTEKGYGKRTPVSEYRLTHRGSKGVKTLNVTEKNGTIVAFKALHGNEDVIIISDNGIVIRMAADQISTMSRVTQGIRLITLKEDQRVSTVALVKKEEETEEEDNVPRGTLQEGCETGETTKE